MTRLYTRAIALGTAAVFAAQTAYATTPAAPATYNPALVSRSLQYHYDPLPTRKTPEPGLETVVVSTDVGVITPFGTQDKTFNAQHQELGLYVDIKVKDKKTGKDVPILAYDVQLWATPAKPESQLNTRDDIFFGNPHKVFRPAEISTKVDEKIMYAPNEWSAFIPKDGIYAVYSEGSVIIATEKGPQALRISGIEDAYSNGGPSFDKFKVVGTKGLPFVYPSEDVKAWVDGSQMFTKGGIWHPQWNHLVYPLEDIMQYEAGKNGGSDFAVMGTGIAPCAPVDPCTTRTPTQGFNPVDCLDAACKPLLFEKLYIVGADTVQKGNRTIVSPSATSTTRTEIQPGQHLVARYQAIDHNMRTHQVTAKVVTRPDGVIALDERVIDGIAVPAHGDMIAVERVLYGMFGVDKNNDGQIGPDEFECRPIAKDATYVEFVPRGHEAEAFAVGAATGLVIGYFLPPIRFPVGHGPKHRPEGTYTEGTPTGLITDN